MMSLFVSSVPCCSKPQLTEWSLIRRMDIGKGKFCVCIDLVTKFAKEKIDKNTKMVEERKTYGVNMTLRNPYAYNSSFSSSKLFYFIFILKSHYH